MSAVHGLSEASSVLDPSPPNARARGGCTVRLVRRKIGVPSTLMQSPDVAASLNA